MDEGKSAVRVARKNLGMTHSTNLPENDIFQRIFFFFAGDTLSTTQIYYMNIKFNYLSLHYFYNYKSDVHFFW